MSLHRRFGVGTVSLGDIMGTIGLTNGGFYKYFQSKEDMIDETILFSFGRSPALERVGPHSSCLSEDHTEQPRRRGFGELSVNLWPVIAYAQHVSTLDPSTTAAQIYVEQTHLLFDELVAALPLTENDTALPKAMFAALVGAELLAQATKDKNWTSAVQEFAARYRRPVGTD